VDTQYPYTRRKKAVVIQGLIRASPSPSDCAAFSISLHLARVCLLTSSHSFLDSNLEQEETFQFDEIQITSNHLGKQALLLRSRDHSLLLAQVKGALPWIPVTSKTDSNEAIIHGLLAATTATKTATEGKHDGVKTVYQSRFMFHDANSRRRFQELTRGRQLLAEFERTRVFVNGTVRSLSQFFQVWSEKSPQSARAEKITYLATAVGTCDEWHIGDFRLMSNTTSSKNGDNSVVELRTRFPVRGDEAFTLKLKFRRGAGKGFHIFLPSTYPKSPSHSLILEIYQQMPKHSWCFSTHLAQYRHQSPQQHPRAPQEHP
jgi:hypothetical protein